MFAPAHSCFAGRAWLLTVLAAAVLSGCGGGGGGAAPTPTPTPAPPASEQPNPPAPPSEPPPPTAEAPRIVGWSGLGNSITTEGSTVSLSVTATGTAPISYQWYRNGEPIEDATASSYTSPVLTPADSGVRFHVIASNSAGQVTSEIGTVTVNHAYIPPTITEHPVSQTVIVGQSATFSVGAASPTPLTYQWRVNGVDIESATDATYTTPPLAAGAILRYDVVVTNLSGSAYSFSAFAHVQPAPPEVIAQPIDQELQSHLVALGSVVEQTGSQRVPATGDATITVSSHERVHELPLQYEATLQVNELEHYQIAGGSFSTLQETLALNRHAQGTVAGLDLDRYDGVLPVTSRRSHVGMDILIAPRSGFAVGIGNWKFIGGEQRGYWSGIPVARGSFIVGEPTDDAVIQDVPSGAYEGFSHGGLEFFALFMYQFEEFSSAAHVTYDASTHELRLALDEFETYQAYLEAGNLNSTWPVFEPEPTNLLNAGATFSCVVTIDPGTNEFSCTLARDGSEPSGTFKGRFYGPEGNEIAGTFALTGLIRFHNDDGMVGAVAVKRVP